MIAKNTESPPLDDQADADAEALEPLLTYAGAAKVLGVTDRTVWGLVNSRELPAVRIGRSVRIDPADLRAFIERQKHVGVQPE